MASIHALVANSAVLAAWLTLAGAELVVGTSEPFSELASTPLAFREAETALEIARRRTTQAGSHPGAQRTVWCDWTRSTSPAGYWHDARHLSSKTNCANLSLPSTRIET